MKYFLVLFLLVFSTVGCKSKKGLFEGKASKDLATLKIIENHYELNNDYSTVYIRANAKYKDNMNNLKSGSLSDQDIDILTKVAHEISDTF